MAAVKREVSSARTQILSWARAAAILAPSLAACTPCYELPKGADLLQLCGTPGNCELPADVHLPLSSSQSQIHLGGDQSVVAHVASALAGLSANPLLSGGVAFSEGALTPSGVAASLDVAALQVTFDGSPVPCDVQPSGLRWSFQCTVGAGVKEIGLTYAAATPAVACKTATDCCPGTSGSDAFCACDQGLCVAPIGIDGFEIAETTPTGPCAPDTPEPE
jgi:hypothetical protein